jgi:hypothetical protein
LTSSPPKATYVPASLGAERNGGNDLAAEATVGRATGRDRGIYRLETLLHLSKFEATGLGQQQHTEDHQQISHHGEDRDGAPQGHAIAEVTD